MKKSPEAPAIVKYIVRNVFNAVRDTKLSFLPYPYAIDSDKLAIAFSEQELEDLRLWLLEVT